MRVNEQPQPVLSFEEIAKKLDLALTCLDEDNVPLATSIVKKLLAELKKQ